MLREQEPMPRGIEVDQGGAQERSLAQDEARAAVLRFERGRLGIAGRRSEGRQFVLAPGQVAPPVDELKGLPLAGRVEADPQGRMACEKCFERGAQTRRGQGALELEDELHEIRVVAGTRLVGMEEQPFLHRRQGPHGLEQGIRRLQPLELLLLQHDQR